MNTVHIHLGLARNSDWAFTSAVVIMVVALLMLAVELAYTRSRTADRELVGAGSVGSDTASPEVVTKAPRRPVDESVGRAGLLLGQGGGLCRVFSRNRCRPAGVPSLPLVRPSSHALRQQTRAYNVPP